MKKLRHYTEGPRVSDMALKLHTPPPDEPFVMRVLKSRALVASETPFDYPCVTTPFSHAKGDNCFFCWHAAERALSIAETGRWEDDGGAT